jgi:dTMP kinase
MSFGGRFIVIEALDGVGTSTLAKGLAARLDGVAMSTPGQRLRPLVNSMLDEFHGDQVAHALLYAATVRSAGIRAREIVGQGLDVVMDRYWLSTVAYALTRGAPIDLNALEPLMPQPDISVLLTLDENERQRRLRARGNATDADIETLDPMFRSRVLHEMRRPRFEPAFRPIEVDVTGADQVEAVARVLAAIRR